MKELPELVAGQTPNVDRKIDRIDLRDKDFFGYEDHFVASVTADLVVPATGTYRFRLASDDGAVLYLDGNPPSRTTASTLQLLREGAVNLTAGSHALNLAYFEEGGQQQLTLEWQRPGETGWKVVDSTVLRTPSGITRVVSPGPKRFASRVARRVRATGCPSTGSIPAGI